MAPRLWFAHACSNPSSCSSVFLFQCFKPQAVSILPRQLCILFVFRLSFTKGHFPKLAECAHFHYENVDFGTIQVKSLKLPVRIDILR